MENYVLLIKDETKNKTGANLKEIELYLKTEFASYDYMIGFFDGYLFDNYWILTLKEYEEKIRQALVVLGEVSEDSTTPRNIRRAAKNGMTALQTSEFTHAVRASNAISLLDDILQDPNMPPYTRVKLWNVMSLIEAIRD